MRLDLSYLHAMELTPEHVRENLVLVERAARAVAALDRFVRGMREAVRAACDHAEVDNCYDPGYAGGGYSHTECRLCGARVPYR